MKSEQEIRASLLAAMKLFSTAEYQDDPYQVGYYLGWVRALESVLNEES